jgi:type II secretory pathway pseudopilin PulG
LIELVVVLSIMALIMVGLLLRQQSFDSSTLLRSLAYSVALSVRQAQVYGTAVHRDPLAGQDEEFDSSYGLYFCHPSIGSHCMRNYYLFADRNLNNQRDTSPAPSEDVDPPSPFTLGNQYSIEAFCVNVDSSVAYCSNNEYDPTGIGSIKELTIIFRRPNPDATFKVFNNVGDPIEGESFSSAYIELRGPGGNLRGISVTTAGQISVCPVRKSSDPLNTTC